MAVARFRRAERARRRDADVRFVAAQLRVGDVLRAARFYRLLGLRTVARYSMRDGQRLVWLQDPITLQTLELYEVPPGSRFFEKAGRRPRFATPLLFSTADSGPVLRRVRRGGGTVRVTFDEGPVRIHFVRDPEGTLFELLSWTRPKAHRPGQNPLGDLRPTVAKD